MKINNSHISKALIACVLLINCDCLFAQNNSEPEFKGLSKAKELQLQDWIAVRNAGPQDRPLGEYVIAFSTNTTAWVENGQGLTVIMLPKNKMTPIIDFIAAEGNNSPSAPYDWGLLMISIYSKTVLKRNYFMDAKQSLAFVNYVSMRLARRNELSERGKRACDGLMHSLTLLQRKDVAK